MTRDSFENWSATLERTEEREQFEAARERRERFEATQDRLENLRHLMDELL